MRALLLILGLVFVSGGLAQARAHTFRFKIVGRSGETKELAIEKRSDDALLAYREAAFDCARQMRRGQRLNDDTILDIVNTCANPRQ